MMGIDIWTCFSYSKMETDYIFDLDSDEYIGSLMLPNQLFQAMDKVF